MYANEINEKISQIPDHLMPEVIDYIDFLLSKYGVKEQKNNHKNKFKFDWEGELSELTDQYSSVELQHKAMDWR